jgi:membrane protein YfhO
MQKLESERSFRLFVIAVFALLAAFNYLPAVTGKIPFPRDIVLQFPAWSGLARSEGVQPYADIGDLITVFYPFRALASRAVRSGNLPLWNPYFQGGVPFQADSQSSLFYPPNFLYYVLPLPVAWTLCLLLRMFLAGLFMTLFVRSIGGTKTGAVFSGIVFASCGFITAWQGQPLGDAAIWLPLICYAVLRLERERTKRSIALAGFAFAMPVLAGHPETAAHLTLVGLFVFAAAWLPSMQRAPRFNAPFLLAFVIAGVLAIGLASIQIFPTIEWVGQMNEALQFKWPPLPLHQGLAWVSRDILRGPNSADVWVPEAATYVGMITLLAASLAPFHKPRKHVVLLAVMTVVGLAVAYGIEPLFWLSTHTPIIAGLKNKRMILLADFGIAALAGLGISVLQRESFAARRQRVIAWCLLGAVFIVAFVCVYKLQAATQFRVEFVRRPSFSRSLLLLGAIPIAYRLFGGLRDRAFSVAVCALAAFDLMTFSYGYMGFAQGQEIFPPGPAFEFLAKHDDPKQFRVAISGVPYPTNANLMYQISSADGYEVSPSLPRRFADGFIENRWDAISLVADGVLKSSDRRLDMLNVKYLVLASNAPEFPQFAAMERFRQVFNNGYVAIFENKNVLPRALIVPPSGIEVLRDADAELERLKSPSFDPQKSVILADPPPLEALRVETAATPFRSEVEMIDSQINQLSFRTVTSTPAALVLSQTWFPGWKATIDEKEAPVLRANMALTGILLPVGSHEIRFVFRPASFTIGAVITILAAGIIVAFIISRA